MATEENKEKIMETALQMFNTRGCKGVTMDDIAQAMHMSKRTLYETFANKEELLAACLMGVHDEIESLHHRCFAKADEPLMVAIYMMRINAGFTHKYQKVIDDAERYYPEIHDRFFKMQTSAFRNMVEGGMKYALEKKYFREGVDLQLSTDFICELVQRHRFSEFEDSAAYARRIKDIGFTYVRGMMNLDTIRRYEEHEADYKQLFEEIDNNK